MILDYRSNTTLAFHTDNAEVEWKINTISVSLTVGTGVYETSEIRDGHGGTKTKTEEVMDTFLYNYHPFSPIALINADNPTFLFKDAEQQNQTYTLLPAFVIYAHTKSAFVKNWLTVAEYTVDILTTLSGFGNILKAGRLYKILEAGKTIAEKTQIFTKIVTGVKGVAGVAEISSGSINILLKLTGLNETDLGREISKYLFYFEMIALSGELSVALYDKMQKSAKAILGEEKLLRESAKNADEAKQVDELIDELKRVAEGGKDGDITKTFFHNARIALKKEKAVGKVFGQSKDYTCASSSLKMILDDIGIVRSEEYLADLIETIHIGDNRGASILDIPKSFMKESRLSSLEVIARGGGKDLVSVNALEKLLKKPGRKAIVSISADDFGAHAIVVDKIENGRVFLRDPLPIYKGLSYSVSLKDFKKVFNDKFVTIK